MKSLVCIFKKFKIMISELIWGKELEEKEYFSINDNGKDVICHCDGLSPLLQIVSLSMSSFKINIFKKFLNKKYVEKKTIDPLHGYVLCNDHPSLPEWWAGNGNFLYMPKGLVGGVIPPIQLHPGCLPAKNYVLALNGKTDYSIMLWGDGGFLYIAENAQLPQSNIALGGGIVFIGEDVRSTTRLTINCRNQGVILLESDILLAADVNLMTDDCHTIISKENNRRINPYGGMIFIGHHVWVGVGTLLMGNSSIGAHTVVGARSFVRNIQIYGECILAGAPAKVLKRGISWDSRDLPPSY